MDELLQRRDLILFLVLRDLRVRYRRSVLGLLWTMLQPLATLTVLYVVFSTVFRFEIANFAVYVLAGLLFWNFFQQSVISSMNSLQGHAAILQKLPVPKAVFPIATVASGVVNLLLALVPLLVILVATGHEISPAVLILPLSILLVALFTLGVGLMLSPLAVFFSDVVEMTNVVMMLLLYMTPVFWPISIVPEKYRVYLELNPLRLLLELFRQPLYEGTLPSLAALSAGVGLTLASLLAGSVLFRRASDRLTFYL